jgi:hypothetical protein
VETTYELPGETVMSSSVSPGNSYVVSTFSCPAGETVAYEMKNSGSTDLNFLAKTGGKIVS